MIKILTESTNTVIRILRQKLQGHRWLPKQGGLGLTRYEKLVIDEKEGLKSKIAVANLLNKRVYQLENYAQANRSHLHSVEHIVGAMGGQVQAQTPPP